MQNKLTKSHKTSERIFHIVFDILKIKKRRGDWLRGWNNNVLSKMDLITKNQFLLNCHQTFISFHHNSGHNKNVNSIPICTSNISEHNLIYLKINSEVK